MDFPSGDPGMGRGPLSDDNVADLLRRAADRVDERSRYLSPMDQATRDLFRRHPFKMRKLAQLAAWYNDELRKRGVEP